MYDTRHILVAVRNTGEDMALCCATASWAFAALNRMPWEVPDKFFEWLEEGIKKQP